MNTISLDKGGFVLMALGFLIGSYVLVLNPASISWAMYGPAFVMTAAGALMLRIAKGRAGGEAKKVSSDINTIRSSLKHLVDQVTAINGADRAGEKVFDVCLRIDAECMDPINDFVDAREAMIHRFGLSNYASMMDSFALGERALNRAWCASADGYIDEVDICLERAQSYLEKALATVEASVSKGGDVPYRDAATESKAT